MRVFMEWALAQDVSNALKTSYNAYLAWREQQVHNPGGLESRIPANSWLEPSWWTNMSCTVFIQTLAVTSTTPFTLLLLKGPA